MTVHDMYCYFIQIWRRKKNCIFKFKRILFIFDFVDFTNESKAPLGETTELLSVSPPGLSPLLQKSAIKTALQGKDLETLFVLNQSMCLLLRLQRFLLEILEDLQDSQLGHESQLALI